MTFPIKSIKSAKSTNTNNQKQLNLNEIQHPQNQKLVFQDYYFLKNFSHIIKLDLSYNKISQFPQGFTFKHYPKLKTLFLHYNKFDKLKNLEILAQCQSLVYFTLFGNPLEQALTRHFCLNIMPWLKLMDDKPVREDQKYQGILNFSDKDQPNQRVGFPLIQFVQDPSNIQFIGNVMRQIQLARDLYLSVNPIIFIQKWWRNKCKKKLQYKNFISQTCIKSNSSARNKQMKRQPSKTQLIKMKDNAQNSPKSVRQQQQQQQQIQNPASQNHNPGCTNNIKIIKLVKYFYAGCKGIKKLMYQQNSIFSSRQYCILNGYKFRPLLTYKNKYIQFYCIPQTHKTYSLQKQKQKKFLSLIFYNNLHYLLQLKSKKLVQSKQSKQDTQLNNVSHKNKLEAVKKVLYDFVEIDMTNENKIQMIKSEYMKCKMKGYLKPFPILFGANILKVSSAIKIQKIWRGHTMRKRFDALKQVRKQSAAKRIQKWTRGLKFKNRHKFLIETYLFLKNNESANILMKLQTFSQLHEAYQKISKKTGLFKLPFQECQFQVVQKQKCDIMGNQTNEQSQLSLNSNKTKVQIRFNAPRQPFPPYYSKFMQNYELEDRVQLKTCESHSKFKIFDLIIKGSKSIKKFRAINDQKKNQKCDYIKFEYQTKEDANQRKFLLCLVTYSFGSKAWVPFKSQKQNNSKTKTIDFNQKIQETHFIKMVYDNNKQQKLFQKIQKYTKQIKPKSQVNWTPIRIRYFKETIDYSCILIVGKYKRELDVQNKLAYDQKIDIQTSRKRLEQIDSTKNLYKKITFNNIDSHLSPFASSKDINRKMVSYSTHLQKKTKSRHLAQGESPHVGYSESPHIGQSQVHYEYKNKNLSSLHSDQSQHYLDWSQDTSVLSSPHRHGQSLPLQNHLQDKSGRKYTTISKTQCIHEKKVFIDKVKSSHKYKLEMLTQIKKRKNQQIKTQYKANEQHNQKLIRQSQNSSLLQNIKKVKRIKQHLKDELSVKEQSQKFENMFLRKGIISMKQQMKEFQKSRSRSNDQKYEVGQSMVRKSARYQYNGIQAQTQKNQGKLEFVRKYQRNFSKQNSLKTELKQFSIQLSQGMDLSNINIPQNESNKQSINVLLKQHKKSKQTKLNYNRQALNSATSQKISKLYQQKRRQFLKSQQLQQPAHFNTNDNIVQKSLLIVNSSNNGQSRQKMDKQAAMQNQKRKLMKKKKLIHSVFPQEFFPLKDSQQIGFHLPKINNNQTKL